MDASADLFARALQRIPGGVNSPVRAFRAVGGAPPFVERAEGAYLFDADGNRLLDMFGSWGPMLLGHAFPPAVAAIRANLSALKIAGGYALEDRGTRRLLDEMLKKQRAAEIVFLDPPYEDAEEYCATLEFLARHHSELLADGAVVIAEHSRKQPLEVRYGVLERTRVLEQGDAALSFYQVSSEAGSRRPRALQSRDRR